MGRSGAAGLAVGLALAVVVSCDDRTGASEPVDDRIELPPASREFRSPSGAFVFAVETPDAWRSKHATGTLTPRDAEPLWSEPLPQEFGPRYAVVDDRGAVLLVDEWIHVKSRHAVVLFDSTGRELAHHGFDDVRRVLDVPAREMARQASLGVWVTTPPELAAEGDRVTIGSAGKLLSVRMSDGRLSVEP